MKPIKALAVVAYLSVAAWREGAMAQEAPTEADREVHIHVPAGKTRLEPSDTVTPAKLVTRVNPVYPPLARQTRISGTVKLHVVITREGTVQQLEVISGHPLLVQSALDAVRQWKYEPTLLNGEPVEVDTTIAVIFQLNQGGPAAPAPAIDPQLRADVLKLLELTHGTERSSAAGRKVFESLRPALANAFAGMPNREKILNSYEERLVGLYETEEFREGVVTAYAKYFNDEDVKGLLQFYQTPLGKKFNDALPDFMADLFTVGQQLARDRVPGILQDLCKEYPEMAGKVPNCSADQPQKKSDASPSEPAGRSAGSGMS